MSELAELAGRVEEVSEEAQSETLAGNDANDANDDTSALLCSRCPDNSWSLRFPGMVSSNGIAVSLQVSVRFWPSCVEWIQLLGARRFCRRVNLFGENVVQMGNRC